ncbi:MAG: phage portal protein [Pseudomonadota bacterium]
MNLIDRLVSAISPSTGLKRARSRKATEAVMRYDAASSGRRFKSWSALGTDADAAATRRDRVSFVARDMIRNAPLAKRAQMVVRANVVGDGIIPSLAGSKQGQAAFLDVVRRHLDTTAIDYRGRLNLYGLQGLVMNTVFESGEALIIRRRSSRRDLALPFQIEVLEPDYLATWRDGFTATGNLIHDGIEYDERESAPIAYHLYKHHPGTQRPFHRSAHFDVERVLASQVIHVYRQDRPGQMRGISWLAPVAMHLGDMFEYQDAQIMKQKVSALLAVMTSSDEEPLTAPDGSLVNPVIPSTLSPGAVIETGYGKTATVVQPPRVDGYGEFTSVVCRAIAAGLGITYESLTGDLSETNYSSARMGRMEMDRNVSSWQWGMMIPQFCDGLARWMREAWSMSPLPALPISSRIEWTPPARIIVDPAKEIPAMRDMVRAGFKTRSMVVRELGYDPEAVEAEHARDARVASDLGLSFETAVGGAMQPKSMENSDEQG